MAASDATACVMQPGERSDAPAATAALADPLVAVLAELAGVLRGVDRLTYRQPAADGTGGIGAHVRHSLDHVTTLLEGLDTGRIDYDRRVRGTAEETDPTAAADTAVRLAQRLGQVRDAAWDRVVQVQAMLRPDDPPLVVACPARRELAFVLSHSIHHHAMIAGMLRAAGHATPGTFGYAPATLAHLRRQQQCPRDGLAGPLQQQQQQEQ